MFTEHRDTNKKPQLRKEVGAWLYKKETVERFQSWCKQHHIKAFNNVKITSSSQFARCLRAAKDVYPGEAVIVVPHQMGFNFLQVVREMFQQQHNFPVTVNWMNHNERVPYLLGASHAELATAGWMCRIHSVEEGNFVPYMKWLLEDTRGRDGAANGISKERGEETSYVDHMFSEMATDACEDPEVWLEHLFRSFACLHLRAAPIETKAILPYLDGTDFFKSKAHELHVPTLLPLVDAIPQLEDGNHNVLVEYFPFEGVEVLQRQCKELGLPVSEMDPNAVRQAGFYALRAMTKLTEGDYLYARGWPKTLHPAEEQTTASMLEATRLINNEYLGA